MQVNDCSLILIFMIDQYKQKIIQFYRSNKVMPSYSEMMKLLGFKSKNAVAKVVGKLIEEGLIEKDSRGRLTLTAEATGFKMLGYVEAGFPTPAEETLSETMSLDGYLINNPEMTFMLTVNGESMIEAGIYEGDLILVERRTDAKDGDIVVAFIDGGYTVKYLRKRNGKVWLDPANKEFTPIIPREDDQLMVMAVVKAVIRKYK